MEETGLAPRRSTPACSSAPATRWARSRCWTSSASTSPQAIGEAIGAAVPASLTALVGEGALGRKSGRGFYAYD